MRRGKTEWVAIRHAYEAGAPTRSIARDFGVPESSIRARAKLEGWPHGQQYESVEEFLFECLSNPEVTAKDKVRIGCVLLAHRDAQRQPAQPRTGKKAEQARIADECNAGIYATPEPPPGLLRLVSNRGDGEQT